ncbi:hypothetical protein OG204_09040 [Streptomyces sp. NBC_01387]|uniref:hypothetical protein n=1 Tax=unclassified Streptomyces TaxID=2593676 RepID=UPI002DDC8E94|nr:hypothetical protein [Streptomyces sp. NBC_01766]WSC22950.1 hypothetical protein OIE60_26580 [Streptomyces sp. NBC_01766]
MSSERPEHDTARPRGRRSPAVVTSVAAAVLLAGGGGAYWASASVGGGSTESSGGSGPPPLALDSAAQHGGPVTGIAPGEPDPGGTVYRARGPLPAGPGKAPVYRADGAVTAAEVTRLAQALGVTGTPRLVGTSWRVGADKDGSGPLLQVAQQAPGTWTYARFGSGGSDNCPQGKGCSADGTAPGGSGTAVSEQAAKAAAAPVLKALGQDDAKLDAGQLTGSVRVVNADPKVGGLPTYGWATGLRIGSSGQLVGGSGQLKEPVKGAEYPLVGAAEALKQLNAPAVGAGKSGSCATVEPLAEGVTPGPGSEKSCGPSSRSPERTPVTIDRAELGLAAQLVGGRQTLVPSWLFETEPTGDARLRTVTATAVDPRYLTHPEPPPGRNHPGTDQKLKSYSTDGRSLTVHFWGGVCGTYDARASESKGAVRVTVDGPNREPGKICVALAKDVTQTVTLDQPLGSRKVVDAASGDAVPQL